MSMKEQSAREAVIRAALRVLSAERPEREHAYADAEAEYAGDQLAVAARDLAAAVEASDRKPIGW